MLQAAASQGKSTMPLSERSETKFHKLDLRHEILFLTCQWNDLSIVVSLSNKACCFPLKKPLNFTDLLAKV